MCALLVSFSKRVVHHTIRGMKRNNRVFIIRARKFSLFHYSNEKELVIPLKKIYLFRTIQVVLPLIGSLSNDNGDGNENFISKYKFALF